MTASLPHTVIVALSPQLREELISAHTATTEARHDLDSCLNRRAPGTVAVRLCSLTSKTKLSSRLMHVDIHCTPESILFGSHTSSCAYYASKGHAAVTPDGFRAGTTITRRWWRATLKLISELQTRISTHELRVSTLFGVLVLVTEPTDHHSSLTAPHEHAASRLFRCATVRSEVALPSAAAASTSAQANLIFNLPHGAQETDMGAQRQKLEQAVDAWRRDAEHWRARYESLATPGVLLHPVAVTCCDAFEYTVEEYRPSRPARQAARDFDDS